ncbi:YihY/virulence factor BrkB family protein [Lutibaculum baratangense]|uniref:Uncharacterized protein n=1 Tax=Lutibaculum baratangense AMV1 TaxID=631454 RepID=V4RBE6_9HYPH|nr:YihY/virulence factor BrkB family protein [Lutibaculum baratangense]ESR23461.1 hypothetical protein N177_3529 [Lutibaculum baratangense AMV1]
MRVKHLFRTALAGWWNDRCLRMGAALSFYTIFSLMPVLLIAISVAGMVYDEAAARAAVVAEFRGLIGSGAAAAVDDMLEGAGDFGTGVVSTATGIALFLILATGAISELQDNLHQIWKVDTRASAVTALIRSRLLSLSLVVCIGFLLLVSLAIDAALAAATGAMGSRFGAAEIVVSAGNVIVSLCVATVLFALVFKLLPEFEIAWWDVLVGAFVTALLFQLGKILIALYIGESGVTSAYGAAGSLVTILLWVYYSSQILLFGAEFVKAYSQSRQQGL